jgi:hypothetical protein
MTRTRARTAVLVAASCVVVLTGCGASEDADDASTTPSAASPAAVPKLDPDDPCAALVGDDGLVDRALAGADLTAEERGPVQDALFAVVAAGPADLQDPAGQLVDYLDDPAAYQPLDGGPDDAVTEAADSIRDTCS